MRTLVSLLLAGLLVVAAAGCGGSKPAPPKDAPKDKPAPAAPAPAAPAAPAPEQPAAPAK